jgi:DNA sulfur modification protein DndB
MLDNIHGRDSFRAVVRRKRRSYELQSVLRSQLDDALQRGWTVVAEGRQTVRIRRDKGPAALDRDRIWTALYAMDFSDLSGEGGARLSTTGSAGSPIDATLDLVAIDSEVALVVQCWTSDSGAQTAPLVTCIEELAMMRGALSREIRKLIGVDGKRTLVAAVYTGGNPVVDTDRIRATSSDVLLLDTIDVNYYAALTAHLGPAARYQFLSDLIPGRTIPGLAITVPAVRSKMGGRNCYTFSISPEYLLKISYVSHRAKGKPSDVDTYQRMVSKPRLKGIARYISEDGIFPTNIVVNIDRGKRGRGLRFERARQEGKSDAASASVGWLTITPAYKSAWIIDGQHRLYAYSGHPMAARSVVSVLAFEDLPPSQQAQLFIDINAQQKNVRQGLLQELYAELHWDSEDALDRVSAVISKAIQTLGQQIDSPLCDRILLADTVRTSVRCISLTSMFSILEKTGFFFRSVKRGVPVDAGPLWTQNNDETLRRTVGVVKGWLQFVAAGASDWWSLGSDPGGGLAMNDGVAVCLSVLKSVFDHLESTGERLVELSTDEVIARVEPFGSELGAYFGAMTPEQRKSFRSLRGIQGQTAGTRQAQAALRLRFPDFRPTGLDEYLETERARTNERGQASVRRIESVLQRLVMDELRDNFTSSPDEWWYEGVPEPVRKSAAERMESDKNQRGGREYYFNMIDYRLIALANWSIFHKLLGYGATGDKQKRTSWLVEVNGLRNKLAHASSGVSISQEQLSSLQEYERWLVELVESDEAPDEQATDQPSTSSAET